MLEYIEVVVGSTCRMLEWQQTRVMKFDIPAVGYLLTDAMGNRCAVGDFASAHQIVFIVI